MLANSVFKGIADETGGSGLRFLIMFTAIGIGFLIPLEISASIWIDYLLGMGMFLLAFWTAAGATMEGLSRVTGFTRTTSS